MHIDLTSELMKTFASRPRKRGRYYASELYGIVKGYITPQTWMYPKPIDVPSALKMWAGTNAHEDVQKFLKNGQNEVKKEYGYKGLVLVAKADHIPDHRNEVWEIKTTDSVLDEAKPSHEFQGKLYCTIFEIPKVAILQPVQSEKGLFLKRLDTFERDDEWFSEQMEKLLGFHEKVERLWDKQHEYGPRIKESEVLFE